jgi:hypothetical protein
MEKTAEEVDPVETHKKPPVGRPFGFTPLRPTFFGFSPAFAPIRSAVSISHPR